MSKRDYSGTVFGKWVVLQELENYIQIVSPKDQMRIE